MKIRFFNEARWQLVQSKSGNPKAINAANPNAKPLYGQEALDAANRQPRQPKAEPAAPARQRDSEQRKAILKPPPSIPAPPKAIAKATTSGQAEVITPKGTESAQTPPHPIKSFLKHLNASPISRDKKIEYGKAVHKVLQNMPQAAKDAFSKVQWSAEFYESSAEMVQHLSKSWNNPELANQIKGFTALMAYNKDGSYTLHLDGGDNKHSNPEVYSHEIGHLVDHKLPDGTFKHSDRPEWKAAWRQEVIGPYAQKSSLEGFAEFSRLVWSGQYKQDAIAKSYPQSYAYFKRHGLLPASQPMAMESFPHEVFDTHIPLKNGSHIDARSRA